MEKPVDPSETRKSPESSRDDSYKTSESMQRNDHNDEGPETNGEKANTDDKTQKRKPFEIIICPNQEYMDYLLMNEEKVFKQLNSAATAQIFEPKNIDTGGQVMDHVISIFDEDPNKKWETASLLFANYYEYCNEHKRQNSKGPEVNIAIPNGMVSLLIGKKGRQISNIMSRSESKIIVSQPQRQTEFDYRRVTIMSPKLENAKEAVKIIVELVEHMSGKMQNVEYKNKPPIDKSSRVEAKLVLLQDELPEVLGKNHEFVDGLAKQFSTRITLMKDTKIKSVENNESIMVDNTYP